MLFEFNTGHKFAHYDVCIAGGGPAGITLAMHLAAKGLKVALLEGGGLTQEPASQSLYETASSGMDVFAASTRLRYFGGTSNHWSGRCRPFVAADFAAPPPTGLPGWPISFESFNQYLPAAMKVLDLPAQGFQAVNVDMPGGRFEADRFAMSAPTRFGTKYLADIKASNHLHLHLHCSLVDVVYDAAGREVKHLEVADLQGRRSTIKADRYVLAMGAIENARLLLNSGSLQAARLPAMHWVGRCFMEHLNVDVGTFMPAAGVQADDLQYFTTDAVVTQAQVCRGNVSFGLLKDVQSYGRTAAVKTFMKQLACDWGVAEKVQFISAFQCPGAGTIGTLLEQYPSEHGSRIELADTKDKLGLRQAKVVWVLSKEDQRAVRSLVLLLAKNFAAAGLGFVKLHPAMTDDTLPLPVSPHAHHMGTTRMAASSAAGVVDGDCKVFDTRNLYIAGSSVFPTGGGGNPTMPLIQLALRLGDHLVQRRRS